MYLNLHFSHHAIFPQGNHVISDPCVKNGELLENQPPARLFLVWKNHSFPVMCWMQIWLFFLSGMADGLRDWHVFNIWAAKPVHLGQRASNWRLLCNKKAIFGTDWAYCFCQGTHCLWLPSNMSLASYVYPEIWAQSILGRGSCWPVNTTWKLLASDMFEDNQRKCKEAPLWNSKLHSYGEEFQQAPISACRPLFGGAWLKWRDRKTRWVPFFHSGNSMTSKQNYISASPQEIFVVLCQLSEWPIHSGALICNTGTSLNNVKLGTF